MKEFILSIPEYWRCCLFMCMGAILVLAIFFIDEFVRYCFKRYKAHRLNNNIIKRNKKARIEQRKQNRNRLVVEQARYEELAERNMKWN